MQCLYSGNGYGKGGNACNIDEEIWGSVLESCNCTEELNPLNMTNSDCQLQLIEDKISCKDGSTSSDCLKTVWSWAKAYLDAVEYDPECKLDPNYWASQELWRACAFGTP